METKNKRLIELLKKGWISNFKACYLLKTAHADRRIRDIRQNPINGYILEEREKSEKIDGRTITYKEYRLVENKL